MRGCSTCPTQTPFALPKRASRKGLHASNLAPTYVSLVVWENSFGTRAGERKLCENSYYNEQA